MTYLYYQLKKLSSNIDKILLLFFTSFILMDFIWIPLNSFASESLLFLSGHDYLSQSNILAVLTEKWWITLLFILLLISNLCIAYLQMALIFIGVNNLIKQEDKPLIIYIKSVKNDIVEILRTFHLNKVFFILAYSIILFPFLRKVLNIYYFNKLIIPQFIIDYYEKNDFLAIIFTLALILFYWLATRVMYALPIIFFNHNNVRYALNYSWQKTKGKHHIKTFFKLLWIITLPIVLFFIVSLISVFVQTWADKLPNTIALSIALIQVVIIKIAYYLAIAFFMIRFIHLLTGDHLSIQPKTAPRYRISLIILTISSLIFIYEGWYNISYPYSKLPVTISHRGVSDNNGVQNSIDALKKTAKLKPNYVEMDVQETKDGKFVVMHDNNLKKLTGHNGETHDYTLSELTAMISSENGQSAPIPSFDEYLTVAEKLDQPLLVEIKTNLSDSKNMMKHFLDEYAERLIKDKSLMHSLDYHVILSIKKQAPTLECYFILPFNSVYPRTIADGYTMEYSSLDKSFILKSQQHHKKVFAWTPNDSDTIMQVLQLPVDGIITDQLALLNEAITELKTDSNYTGRLSRYITGLTQLW